MSLTVPASLNLEHESLLVIEQQLSPWRVTRVGQGDDFGRDGFVQIIDHGESRDSAAQADCFAIQVKSTREAFSDLTGVRLKTRHLRLWSQGIPVVVAAWSKESQETRWRLATEIIAEVGRHRLDEQESIRVPFRDTDAFHSPHEMREQLERRIADCYDRQGGIHSFHSSIRRVLLTDLYPQGRSRTSQGYTLEGTTRDLHFEHGPSWKNGDLNPAEVHAPRVLAGALILYERVWFPLAATDTVFQVLGAGSFSRLLNERRLIPFRTRYTIGTGWNDGDTDFEIMWARAPVSPEEQVAYQCREFATKHDLPKRFASDLETRVRVLDSLDPERIKKETLRDLSDQEIRSALGLGYQKENAREALWDRDPVRRLIHLNEAAAVAQIADLDVMEFESGLAKLGATKWYSAFGFNRTFESQAAFCSVLDDLGVPDVGVVAQTLGMETCVQLSSEKPAAQFRDWFWSSAAHAAAGGVDVTAEVVNKLKALMPESVEAIRLPTELKLRVFEKVGKDYLIGSSGLRDGHRVAIRSMGGDQLRVQAQNHRILRMASIKENLGHLPERNDPCPCGSMQKFKKCCGRPV